MHSVSLLLPRPPIPYSLLSSWHGSIGPLLTLSRLGLPPDQQDPTGRTALHLAAFRGHTSVLGHLVTTVPHLLESRDARGQTPLHLAASTSHLSCVALLLNHGANPSPADFQLSTPLHLSTATPVVELLLVRGADATRQTAEGTSVLRHYLHHVPTEVTTLLTSFLTRSGQALTAHSLEVGLSMQAWQAEMVAEETDMLAVIAAKEGELLKHPVCEAFIHLKDDHVGSKFRVLFLLLYVVFLLSLTCLVMVNHSPWVQQIAPQDVLDTMYTASLLVSIVFIVILILREIIFAAFFPRSFLTDSSNLLWLLLLNLSTIYISRVADRSLAPSPSSLQLGTSALVLAWLLLTSILGRSPGIGIYVLMVRQVAKDVLGFLLIYSITLVAFALGFHLVLHSPSHRTPLSSFVATLAMMYGEADFATKFSDESVVHHGITEVLFILFLLFVGIIIMNLLIGLSISNIPTIFKSSGIHRLILTVKHVSKPSSSSFQSILSASPIGANLHKVKRMHFPKETYKCF